MESTPTSEVTRVLNAMGSGDHAGSEELLKAIYDELRRMAGGRLAMERAGHSLNATELVHEAYLKLAGNERPWQNRRHFFGAASEAMRRLLVDYARRRVAWKRGGGKEATEYDEEFHAMAGPDDAGLLRVNEVLDALEAEDAIKAQIVKLRVFVGLGHEEIAALLDLNEKTVRRHWELAKLRLYRAIRDEA